MWTFQENFRKDFDWHITPRLVVMELVKKRIQLQHIKLFLNKVQGKSQKCWALSLTPEGVRLKRLHEGIAGERGSISSFWTGNLAKSYPDNRGFTWQTKNGEKRKNLSRNRVKIRLSMRDRLSRSLDWSRWSNWLCNRVYSRVTLALELCAYLLAKTVPTLSKWPETRRDFNLVVKLYCVMLNMILTRFIQRFSVLSNFHVPRKNLCC